MTDLRCGVALAGALAVLFAAGCSSQPAATVSPRPSVKPGSSPASNVQVPSANPAAGPTSVGAFDAAHAAQVLGPSVALVISSGVAGARGSGVAEGSGFAFISQGGTSYLLTNNHVIEGASRVQVLMPDGRHFVATVQGADALEDIAVLRVGDTLPLAQLADSSRVVVGQPVVAIGSPLGSQGFGSVTTGVISALHRTLSNVGGGATSESLGDVLQTDAPINPGNSGGPLGDGSGRVVGMNTAGSTQGNGIGFAIPSAILQRIGQNLVQGRTPGHPYLGICFSPIETALASNPSIKGYGVVVDRALPGTPAEKAGFQNGDVIEKIDGTDLNNGQTLGGVLQLHNPGDTVRMTTLRSSGTTDVTVTLGDRPASGGPAC
jgi:serine protease Do